MNIQQNPGLLLLGKVALFVCLISSGYRIKF